MALLENDKTNVIRHLGYEVIGLWQTSPAGGSTAYGNMGYRYFSFYGTLIGRLNQLKPDEEARIAGKAYGGVAFTGLSPTPGDIVGVEISGGNLASPVSVSVTVPQLPIGQTPWSLLTVAAALAQQFTLQLAFTNAGFVATADYGGGPYTQSSTPVPIVSVIAPPSVTSFNVSVSYTGTTVPQIYATGQKLSPYMNFTRVGQVNVIYGYLPILDALEAGYLGESANLSVDQANNTRIRHDAIEQREELYDKYRRRFAKYMGIPLGPGQNWQDSGANSFFVGY